MRITSKYRDYWHYISNIYDPAQEETLVFSPKYNIEGQNQSILDLDKLFPKSGRVLKMNRLPPSQNFKYLGRDYKFDIKLMYLIVCGTLYPLVNIKIIDIASENKILIDEFCYTLLELNEVMEGLKLNYKFKPTPSRVIRGVKPNFFNRKKLQNSSEDYICSVFSANKELTVNILLKDYKFNKVLTSEQVYQQIDTYLGSIRNIEVDKQFSDTLKRDSKGFNSCSFKSCHPSRNK